MTAQQLDMLIQPCWTASETLHIRITHGVAVNDSPTVVNFVVILEPIQLSMDLSTLCKLADGAMD